MVKKRQKLRIAKVLIHFFKYDLLKKVMCDMLLCPYHSKTLLAILATSKFVGDIKFISDKIDLSLLALSIVRVNYEC